LIATHEALAKQGYERANVNDIARRAGVSVGSLYRYFPTKDALVAALIERHTADTLATLEAELAAAAGESLPVAVRRVVRSMLRAHAGPGDRELARELDRMGRLDALQREIDARAGAAVASFLVARRGEVSVPRVELAAILLVRLVDGASHAVLVDSPHLATVDELEEELVELVLAYLTASWRRGSPRPSPGRPG
jgi:AcrR family transcriptional regulator